MKLVPSLSSAWQLKSICVPLSRQALHHLKAPQASQVELIKLLQKLYSFLQAAKTLDPKRADYIFFPLSCVFRSLDSLAPTAVALSVKCIHILVVKGWQRPLELDSFQQLSVLLHRILLQEEKRHDDQDAFRSTLECLAEVFGANGSSVSYDRIEMKAVTGRILDVQLNSLKMIDVPLVQRASCRGVFSIVRSVEDRTLLLDVLPGVVSRLTTTLCKPTTSREVAMLSLKSISQLLSKTVASEDNGLPNVVEPSSGLEKDQAWWKETGVQVRLALVRIAPLCEHEKEDVVAALFGLCMLVIEKCRRRLGDSLHVVLQTATKASGRENLPGSEDRRNQLVSTVRSSSLLRDRLAQETYDHLLNMPTLIQATSEKSRARALQFIRLSWDILHRTRYDLAEFEPLLLEEVLAAVIANKPVLGSQSLILQLPSNDSLAEPDTLKGQIEDFRSLPTPNVAPEILLPLRNLVASMMDSGSFARFKNLFQDKLENSSRERRMALLWIISRVLEYDWNNQPSVTASSLPTHETRKEISAIGYEHALHILSMRRGGDECAWQLEALSFEIVAFRAQELQHDFLPELAEVLYPIVESIAAKNKAAMVCLRLVSRSCGYASPSEALLKNNDYLVSAIAIKLNSLDLNLDTLRVLDVTLRISGAALIPYLQDVIDSLFSLLVTFHGYSKLVEHISQVFQTVVELASGTVPLELASFIISQRAYRSLRQSTRAISGPESRSAGHRRRSGPRYCQDRGRRKFHG